MNVSIAALKAASAATADAVASSIVGIVIRTPFDNWSAISVASVAVVRSNSCAAVAELKASIKFEASVEVSVRAVSISWFVSVAEFDVCAVVLF